MKRFYKMVSLGTGPDGHSILLDGKPVKTPLRNALTTPHKALADAILREWAAQQDKINPDSMPLTQLLSTKIDRVPAERAIMTEGILKYLNTDLLCYRADHPPEIACRQAESWDPWLGWFEKKFGVALETTPSLKALRQPAAAHQKVQTHIQALNDDQFTILQLITPITGSLVLALAFVEQALAPQTAYEAARVEETYKAELYDEKKYGPDPAQEKKDRAVLADLDAAAKFLDLIS